VTALAITESGRLLKFLMATFFRCASQNSHIAKYLLLVSYCFYLSLLMRRSKSQAGLKPSIQKRLSPRNDGWRRKVPVTNHKSVPISFIELESMTTFLNTATILGAPARFRDVSAFVSSKKISNLSAILFAKNHLKLVSSPVQRYKNYQACSGDSPAGEQLYANPYTNQ
jgi:hypothetical protein